MTRRQTSIPTEPRPVTQVNEEDLGEFIAERNKVVQGTYDAGVEGTWKTDQLARYGLNLLEKLLLRLLQYEGSYYDRRNVSTNWLPRGDSTL